jgi:transcriptional regulator with XRE-family HTH domain
MPEPTPDRAGIEPPEGALFPSQILARNLGGIRRLGGYRQELVAERMNFLGHPWTRQTVGEVEQNRRNVTVDELLSLALVFGITVARLLDAQIERAALGDLEGLIEVRPKPRQRKVALLRPTSAAVNYANTQHPEMLIDDVDMHGVLCGHEAEMYVAWDNLERWRLRKIEFHKEGDQ